MNLISNGTTLDSRTFAESRDSVKRTTWVECRGLSARALEVASMVE
jgi:hypothetical protein